jgi:5'-deoxynucleotidase YfbR-like HD superfamily hydrolase
MRRDEMMGSRQLAGRVTRWHTWPMIRKPSVAEHASRVATLYVELWGMPRAEVLYYALVHDHGEFTAGDVPFSAKSLVEGLRENVNEAEKIGRSRLDIVLPELMREEFLRFKICDLLEMFETGLVEWNMGNTYCGVVVTDCANEAVRAAYRLDLVLDPHGPGDPSQRHVQNWLYANGYKGAAYYDVK